MASGDGFETRSNLLKTFLRSPRFQSPLIAVCEKSLQRKQPSWSEPPFDSMSPSEVRLLKIVADSEPDPTPVGQMTVELAKLAAELEKRYLNDAERERQKPTKSKHDPAKEQDGEDKRDGRLDTPKKSPRISKRRQLNGHGAACIKEFKAYKRRGDPQSMRYVVKEYVADHTEVKESSLYKMLSDNSDQWKR